MNKSWKTWTSKEEDLLEQMRLEGKTVRECAIALNRTHQSVRMRSQTLKFSRAKPTWHLLLMEEHNLRDIANMCGKTYGTVKREKNRLIKLGFNCPPSIKKRLHDSDN